jgi:TonB family protein
MPKLSAAIAAVTLCIGVPITTVRAYAAPAAPQRIKVAADVQNKKAIRQIPPKYPKRALMNEQQGFIVFDAVIGTNGHVLSLRPQSKSYNADLLQAAGGAVMQWLYQPTLLNGKPVEVETTITVPFKLD